MFKRQVWIRSFSMFILLNCFLQHRHAGRYVVTRDVLAPWCHDVARRKAYLTITLMYCKILHAWWSTQSRLATLLSSLIPRRWVGLQTQTYDRSDFNTYLLIRWQGPGALVIVIPTGVYLLGFFSSGIQFYVLWSPYLCFIFVIFFLYVLGDYA